MARIATELPWGKWFEESGSMLSIFSLGVFYLFWTMPRAGYDINTLNDDDYAPEDLGLQSIEVEQGKYTIIGDIPQGACFYITDNENGETPDPASYVSEDDAVYGNFCDR